MQPSLDAWQERVDKNYNSLANERKNFNMPIFALEHGLSAEEIQQISSLLQAQSKIGANLEPYWLLWLIYATEHGYKYNGDEYWWSFKSVTPGWDYSDRYKIIRWFRKFQQKYNGFTPVGPWASHFKIIAWPVTHSIVPRFLQYQLAKLLYELRYALAKLETLEPSAIGTLLANNVYNPTTRFAQFLQQEELVGRLVLGLLGQDLLSEKEPIYKPTLERILVDLESLQNTREWLGKTRSLVRDRFHGIAQGRYRGMDAANTNSKDSHEIQKKIITSPDIILRHDGDGTWIASLVLPSLKPLSFVNQAIKDVIVNSHCVVRMTGERKPPGWILAERSILLQKWPTPEKSLISFEKEQVHLNYILQNDYQFSYQEPWVFKIGKDFVARQIKTQSIAPGHQYILVSTSEIQGDIFNRNQCHLNCRDVYAYTISVPEAVTNEDLEWLKKNHLNFARTISFWPAGIFCRGWDREGNSEWLTTETPCFSLSSDSPVKRYLVSLNTDDPIIIRNSNPEAPIFISLPKLPIGVHYLEVEAETEQQDDFPTTIIGNLRLLIRDPQLWTPGISGHSGLIVNVNPYNLGLDDFWQNKADVSILGPGHHYVTCKVNLYTSEGAEILSEQIGPPLELPLIKENWKRLFSKFLDKHTWDYLEASYGTLSVDGEELGKHEVSFERQQHPLQWKPRKSGGDISLRLIDNVDSEVENVAALYFSIDQPAKPIQLNDEEIRSGITINPPGGLYIVQHGEYKDSILVAPTVSSDGLKGLLIASKFEEIRDDSITISQLLHLLQLWSNARPVGNLVEIQRKKIVDGFSCELHAKLYGDSWVHSENKLLSTNKHEKVINELKNNIKDKSFSAAISQNYLKLSNDFAEQLNWFHDLAQRYKICSDKNLSEFALILSADPIQALSKHSHTQFETNINNLKNKRSLLQGARLLNILLKFRSGTNISSNRNMYDNKAIKQI